MSQCNHSFFAFCSTQAREATTHTFLSGVKDYHMITCLVLSDIKYPSQASHTPGRLVTQKLHSQAWRCWYLPLPDAKTILHRFCLCSKVYFTHHGCHVHGFFCTDKRFGGKARFYTPNWKFSMFPCDYTMRTFTTIATLLLTFWGRQGYDKRWEVFEDEFFSLSPSLSGEKPFVDDSHNSHSWV